MKVVGIIAEYNPFHSGHAYQIQYAKNELGADAVIIVMSGPFTQRGIPAIFDKYTRADAAISCGADLVLELPVCYATASAERFASGGLKVMSTSGIVDTLLFGCETPDISLFKNTATLLLDEPESYQAILRKKLAAGNSFAKARSVALSAYPETITLEQPNDILALEYVKAILKNNYSINPVPMERIGSEYHDLTLDNPYASASAIRHAILNGNASFTEKIPKNCVNTYNAIFKSQSYITPGDFDLIMQYALLSRADFVDIVDCSQDLSNKILHNIYNYESFDSFCGQLKSKNITHARISRVLCHIMLNLTEDTYHNFDANTYVPYLRVLSSSNTGALLMKEIKKRGHAPIVTSPKDYKNIAMLEKDIFASDLYRSVLSNKTGNTYPNEFTRKFTIS